jgi:hypothetical protein
MYLLIWPASECNLGNSTADNLSSVDGREVRRCRLDAHSLILPSRPLQADALVTFYKELSDAATTLNQSCAPERSAPADVSHPTGTRHDGTDVPSPSGRVRRLDLKLSSSAMGPISRRALQQTLETRTRVSAAAQRGRPGTVSGCLATILEILDRVDDQSARRFRGEKSWETPPSRPRCLTTCR